MNGSQDTPIYDRRKKKSIFNRFRFVPGIMNLSKAWEIKTEEPGVLQSMGSKESDRTGEN